MDAYRLLRDLVNNIDIDAIETFVENYNKFRELSIYAISIIKTAREVPDNMLIDIFYDSIKNLPNRLNDDLNDLCIMCQDLVMLDIINRDTWQVRNMGALNRCLDIYHACKYYEDEGFIKELMEKTLDYEYRKK